MKTRYYSIILIWAALFAGCTPNGLDSQKDGDSLRGVIDSDLAATKAMLLDNPGIKLESFWVAGDQIGVFGGNAENAAFKVTAEDLSADGKTANFRTDANIPNGRLTAYSPYQEGAKKEGDGMVINFPDRQQYLTVNGVVQPDPVAHILLAEGSRGGGLTFRSVISVLKIGQMFETETTVKSVEFRDLSGAPVTGAMKLSGTSAEIIGEGKVLSLDLGEGLTYPAGTMRPVFLIVPARSYAQGFEVTFVDDKGGKTVRTVGKAMGKTLERGVVYLIGDISDRSYPEGTKAVLKEGAVIMTPEVLDNVVLTQTDQTELRDDDGTLILNENGYPVRRPVLQMNVNKGLHPVEGGYLIFDQPSDILPEGGVFKIKACRDLGNGQYEVEAWPEANFAAPFEELIAGEPLYDEEGKLREDGGIELDLASFVKSIKDADGNEIPFSVDPSGQLCFADEDVERMLDAPGTKAILRKTFSPPKMTLNHAEKNAEVSFGAKLSLSVKMAAGMVGGELQYIHFTANPVFELSAGFVLKGEAKLSYPFHLITIEILPFPLAPGVLVTPSLNLSGEVGVGGEIKFSTSVSYTYDMGTYGLSYNRGDGITARHVQAPAAPAEIQPALDGFTGDLYAYGTLTAAPYLSVYGLFGLGLEAGFTLKFGLGYEDKTKATKLHLTPELELVPSVAVLGGRFSKRFSDLTTKMEFDDIWEAYLTPKVEMASSGPVSVPLSDKFYDFPSLADDENGHVLMQVTTSPRKWSYNVELQEETLLDYEVQARVYESSGKVDSESYFIYSDPPEGITEKPFQKYLEAGIPHMYWFLDDVRNPDIFSDPPSSPRLVSSHTIGIYSAGTKGHVFDGEFSAGSITSGHAYWSSIYLVHGGIEIPIGGSSQNRVYFWPTDFWGHSYKESE